MLLEKLQNDFFNMFANEKASPAFLKYIRKAKDLSQRERLDIYQDSIKEGLANALRDIYPVCEKLVGDKFFTGMAYRYIEQTPSHSSNLFDYGKTFPSFVATFEPASSLPYLSDVCRLELACHEAYYAPDNQPIDVRALETINAAEQADTVFKLPTGSTLIQSPYPILRIWEANQDDYQGNEIVNLDEGGVKLLVWRQDMHIRMNLLSEKEWLLLHPPDRSPRDSTRTSPALLGRGG